MKKSLLQQFLYTIISLLITIISVLATWIVGTFMIIKFLFGVLPGVKEAGGEGPFTIGVMATGLSPVIALVGLIPAYFLSMRLAEYLREKHRWVIKHPQRLFVASLAIPIILFVLLTAFIRRS